MKRTTIYALIIGSLIIPLSFKWNVNFKPAGTLAKVKTLTAEGKTYTYKYGNDGRVTLITVNDSSQVAFQYLTGKIIRREIDKTGKDTMTTTYLINSRGLADSLFKSDFKNHVVYTISYKYDADGFPLSEKKYSLSKRPSELYNYTFDGGNLKIETEIDYDTGVKDTVYSEYYTDKINTISNANEGKPWFGRPPVNLEKKCVYHYSNGAIDTNSFEYEYDADGRVTLLIATSVIIGKGLDDSKKDTVKFTYY